MMKTLFQTASFRLYPKHPQNRIGVSTKLFILSYEEANFN